MTRLTKQQADAITARNRASWKMAPQYGATRVSATRTQRYDGKDWVSPEVFDYSNALKIKSSSVTTKPSKYRNVKTVVDGTTFDSKKEVAYFQQLNLRKAAGEILGFVRQVSVPIGKSKRRLRLDFVVFNLDGTVEWIDVKGMQTPNFQIKRDELEANTPIRVRTV